MGLHVYPFLLWAPLRLFGRVLYVCAQMKVIKLDNKNKNTFELLSTGRILGIQRYKSTFGYLGLQSLSCQTNTRKHRAMEVSLQFHYLKSDFRLN